MDSNDIHAADHAGERRVLILIGGGLIGLIAAVIAVIAALAVMTSRAPDFAETVFGAIVGGALVKIADVLSALVALSSNRQMARVTDRLSISGPPFPTREPEKEEPPK